MTDADLDYLLTPRHIDEWHEDIGQVFWWTFPIDEAPYVGSPLDCGLNIPIRIGGNPDPVEILNLGGWPGYHKWWTPLPTNEQVGLIQSRIDAAIKAREATANV